MTEGWGLGVSNLNEEYLQVDEKRRLQLTFLL